MNAQETRWMDLISKIEIGSLSAEETAEMIRRVTSDHFKPYTLNGIPMNLIGSGVRNYRNLRERYKVSDARCDELLKERIILDNRLQLARDKALDLIPRTHWYRDNKWPPPIDLTDRGGLSLQAWLAQVTENRPRPS